MHPLLRNLVIGLVGLIIAGALTALALVGQSIPAMLAAAALGLAVGIFLFAQGWIWGSDAARRHQTANSVLIAIGGGLAALIAAVALAGFLILLLLFYLG